MCTFIIIMWRTDKRGRLWFANWDENQSGIKSVFPPQLCYADRSSWYLFLGLPVANPLSDLPGATTFANWFLLITWTRNDECLRVISLIIFFFMIVSLRAAAVAFLSAHKMCCIFFLNYISSYCCLMFLSLSFHCWRFICIQHHRFIQHFSTQSINLKFYFTCLYIFHLIESYFCHSNPCCNLTKASCVRCYEWYFRLSICLIISELTLMLHCVASFFLQMHIIPFFIFIFIY